ncbi:hypothetical protein CDAR_168901 [Caerostris darwini]|uniref:Uncharacterized protein n=1 Tax=Caerostris darwini TaxID=1538125 RepID=A0AAV4WRW2_9ARAC|nr:hypothetical protein CDAR_168901 [Caerostris darwini]
MTLGRFSPRYSWGAKYPPRGKKNEYARQTGRTHRSPLSTNMTVLKAFPAPSLTKTHVVPSNSTDPPRPMSGAPVAGRSPRDVTPN